MQATSFEYRFRVLIHMLIYALGFFGVPLIAHFTPGLGDALSLSTKSTWLVATSMVARAELLNFTAASFVLLGAAIVLTGLGAAFRVWGTAYVGFDVVQSSAMHGRALVADGPYRRTRNPLYLGTLLHTVGVAILMPPAGTIFTVVLIWIFEVRLALAEEGFLTVRFGQGYLDYKAAVPRFLPAPAPQVPAAGATPHWLQAMLGEFYFLGVFVTLLGFGWQFNAMPLYRGFLISLGVSLIVQAFLPKAADPVNV